MPKVTLSSTLKISALLCLVPQFPQKQKSFLILDLRRRCSVKNITSLISVWGFGFTQKWTKAKHPQEIRFPPPQPHSPPTPAPVHGDLSSEDLGSLSLCRQCPSDSLSRPKIHHRPSQLPPPGLHGLEPQTTRQEPSSTYFKRRSFREAS